MVYTNDCVNGISASNAGLRCIANPQPGNGFGYITYLTAAATTPTSTTCCIRPGATTSSTAWAPAARVYYVFNGHDNSSGWDWGNFSGYFGGIQFTPTDAGYLPTTETVPRQLWIRRGWGYGDYPTGRRQHQRAGSRRLVVSHFATLMALLGNETPYGTGEIKNNTFFTPIAGTLGTVRDYFRGNTTPITQTCQRNFVMLATDGNPTGRTDGNQYDPSQWQNTLTRPASGPTARRSATSSIS